MSSLLDSIFTCMRTSRQPVSDRTGAAPVIPPGEPEIPTEQPMGETGPGVGVTVSMRTLRSLISNAVQKIANLHSASVTISRIHGGAGAIQIPLCPYVAVDD